MFLTENEARLGPILWRLGFRIDHSVDDMHNNKRSSHVRWYWVMVVGGTRSNDMRRASSLSVRQMGISEPEFPYHRLAASCTSAERDLHNPNANERVIGNPGKITELRKY
jgi:hypothetical protein